MGPAPREAGIVGAREASAADRAQQVERILADRGDAFSVLGLDEDASASQIKKHFWRLSLLIHPDKCEHPRARDAFDRLNKAKDRLVDPEERKKMDEKLADQALWELAEAEARRLAEAEEWKAMKAGATLREAREMARPTGGREAWMTDPSIARRSTAAAAPPQRSVTSFSQKARNNGPVYLGATPEDLAKAAEQPVVVNRGPSLLEKHREKLARQGKGKGKSPKPTPEPTVQAPPTGKDCYLQRDATTGSGYCIPWNLNRPCKCDNTMASTSCPFVHKCNWAKCKNRDNCKGSSWHKQNPGKGVHP
mgnify:CR=1 FL=1